MSHSTRDPQGPPSSRRVEARGGASERVTLRVSGEEVMAWALNTTPGGVRVLVEATVEVGAQVTVEDLDAGSRPARVVWTQTEADGQILGLEYLPTEGH